MPSPPPTAPSSAAEVAPTHPRHIPLEGCFNFRDLGGYEGADGRPVRWRTLFRADGLTRLTAADLTSLSELGLRTVIDLRTADEVTKGRIDPAQVDLTYHHLPMMDVLPPEDELPSWADPMFVAGQYQDMLRSGAVAIRSALELLARAESYPVAYHCMAGKDRTGVLSALVLELLGVAEAEIVGDYALSGAAMQRMLDWLRVAEPERSKQYEAGAAAMVAAEPASMARFLEVFRSEHGSVEAYVASLGLDGIGEELRALLLEPAGAGA
jgi:protein-tyrosine phosphatase